MLEIGRLPVPAEMGGEHLLLTAPEKILGQHGLRYQGV